MTLGFCSRMRPLPALPAQPAPTKPASEIATVVALLTVLTIGSYLPTPLYPLYQQLFDFDDLMMTSVYATATIAAAPALLLFGPASDALGRRMIILISIALGAVGALCFLLATGAGWLLLGRAAQGLSLAAATAAGTVLVVERTPPERLARTSLLVTAAWVIGPALGTLLSGFAAEFAPFPRHTPYALLLALFAVIWVRASRIDSPPTMSLRSWRPVRPRVPRRIRAGFTLAAMSVSLAWITLTLFLAVIPALLLRFADVTSPAVTGSILAAMLVCSMLTQPFVVRLGASTLQLAGALLLLFALLGLALDGGRSVIPTAICAVIAGFGHGMSFGGATASIDSMTTTKDRASVNAAYYVFSYLATGVPAVAVGVMTKWMPLSGALSVFAWLGVAIAAATITTTARLMLGIRRAATK